MMGQLIVRSLDDILIQTLRQRAVRLGRSAEAEHRAILEQVLRPEVEGFAEARLLPGYGRKLHPKRLTAPTWFDRTGIVAASVHEGGCGRCVSFGQMGCFREPQRPSHIVTSLEARHAPDHWQAEASNVLRSKVFKGDLTSADAEARMTVLMRAPVVGRPIAGLMPRAFAISVANAVTIYDSLYIALAEKRNIPMVTADERLVRRMSGDAELTKHMIWIDDI